MIRGYCDYKEYKMSQHENVLVPFRQLIEKTKPKRILEIGTYTGGFIVAIKDIVSELKLSTTIDTYDISERREYNSIRSMGVNVRIKNIFNSTYTDLNDEAKEVIVDQIQSPGVTLVLCDGGNKINEFNALAKYLKSDDIIMAHDYSYSKEYYHEYIRDKVWNWCEITYSDIQSACEENNLKDFMKDEFQSVVWVCKRKD